MNEDIIENGMMGNKFLAVLVRTIGNGSGKINFNLFKRSIMVLNNLELILYTYFMIIPVSTGLG